MDDLDNPVWAALVGPHAPLAVGTGRVRRYDADVAIFWAADRLDDGSWRQLADLADEDDHPVLVSRSRPVVPEGWTEVFHDEGVQQVAGPRLAAAPSLDEPVVPLTDADADEMVALARRTQPGPFDVRTVALGGYVGIRVVGELVAMAGRRFATDHAVEISAVCTDAAFRGRGFGAGLTLAVAAEIVAEGRTPFLHTVSSNDGARRLYTSLGFETRTTMHFVAVRPPR